jgi:intein/homing endonuclease
MAVIEGNGFSYALENRLIKKLDIMIDRTIRDKPKLDAWLAIEGAEGCLAGDTEVIIRRKIEGRKGVFRKYKLKDLYYAKHSFNKNISSYIRSYNCSKIKYTKIKDITYSGLKKTYLLTLENKLNIRATATHKFLTGFRASKIGDWKRLKDLKVGEPIMYEGIEGTTKRIPKFSKISSIKENNILEETYDIECERFHCFSANGIIVHNSGKSNTACANAYYVKLKTGKDIHLFFRLEPLIRMAQQTEG